MANPVKVIKGAVGMVKLGARSMVDEKIISSATKKKKPSLKQAQKAKPLANPKSGVKVLPRKSAPKSGLEGRGNKVTSSSQKKAAIKIQEDKWEKYVDQRFDTFPGGPRADYNMANKGRGASPKKVTQHKAIEKAATKKQPIKINSQRNLKKKGK